jgi:hypothetical protein
MQAKRGRLGMPNHPHRLENLGSYTQEIPLRDRLYSHTQISDGCWIWTGNKQKDGYGVIGLKDGRRILAHRASWFIHSGEIPSLCVLHKCDNPACVRFDHLFLGTRADNVHDMESKGRARKRGMRGEENPHSKVTLSTVRQIRIDRESGMTKRQIADKHGCAFGHIKMILRGQIWKDSI